MAKAWALAVLSRLGEDVGPDSPIRESSQGKKQTMEAYLMWPRLEEEQIKGCSNPKFVFRAPLRTLGLVEEELGPGGRGVYD